MAIDFSTAHKNFDGLIFDLCSKCGGSCESNQISLLFPGEEMFLANMLEIPLELFVSQFCNIIEYNCHTLFVLKLGHCPFLLESRKCNLEIRFCKPLRCKLYPVIITLHEGLPKITVDEFGCKMVKRIQPAFFMKAAEICNHLIPDISYWWLEFAEKYDNALYDYNKLNELRNKKIIKARDLEKCSIMMPNPKIKG